MPNFVLIGARVCEPRRVKVEGFPSKTYMAYNTLHCSSVHACDQWKKVKITRNGYGQVTHENGKNRSVADDYTFLT